MNRAISYLIPVKLFFGIGGLERAGLTLNEGSVCCEGIFGLLVRTRSSPTIYFNGIKLNAFSERLRFNFLPS